MGRHQETCKVVAGGKSKWISTGQRITLKDGSQQSLYRTLNPRFPGELRVRRMRKNSSDICKSKIKKL